jgi:hypothetical protein
MNDFVKKHWQNIQGWWDRHFLCADLTAIVVLWILAIGAWCLFKTAPYNDAERLLTPIRQDIFRTLLPVAISVLGFSLASISFTYGILSRGDRSELLGPLLNSPFINDLWDTFFSIIRWAGLGFALSIVGWFWFDAVVVIFAAVALVVAVVATRTCRAVGFLKSIVFIKPSHLD